MSIRKLKIIIITTVLLLIAFSTIFAATITHFAPEYAKTTANVNFRSSPITDYSSYIKTLSTNTPLKLVGSIDNYYIAQLENNEVGVVSKDYVDITGDKTQGLVYEDYSPFYVRTNTENVILRGGPSTSFRRIATLPISSKLLVQGKIDNFYLVVTENNTVGMVRDDLVDYYDNTNNSIENNSNESIDLVQDNNATIPDKNYILEKINAIRSENGLPLLAIDSLLDSVAQNKAKDMVENNYFAHNSPTYGTPFEMMQNAGVTYVHAGENIAGNSNIDAAIEAFLNSDTHKQNILSNAYNYIGIGIEPSNVYGYIIVLMFIGR